MPVTIKLRFGFWGDQPFSCPCSLTVTHCRKKICSTYLFQESMPFGSGMVFPLQKRECCVPYKPQKGMKIVEQKGSYTRLGPPSWARSIDPCHFVGNCFCPTGLVCPCSGFVSKKSCEICATVWGLRWCNFTPDLVSLTPDLVSFGP